MRKVINASLMVAMAAASVAVRAQPSGAEVGPVVLPPEAQRSVVGIWSAVDVPVKMTRSIEVVNGKYYMVSRVVDPAGKREGGTHGLPLQKVDDHNYRAVIDRNTLWSVAADGTLTGAINGKPFLVAKPAKELWPR